MWFGILLAIRMRQLRDRLMALALMALAVGAFLFGWRWPK